MKCIKVLSPVISRLTQQQTAPMIEEHQGEEQKAQKQRRNEVQRAGNLWEKKKKKKLK